MAREIMAGVWRLERARGCNVYLVDVGGTLALVDSGLASGAHAVALEVERLGLGRPSLLLLTHAHRDHAGGAAVLRRAFDCRVVLGVGDCETRGGQTRVVASPARPFSRWLRQAHALAPTATNAPPPEVDLPLTGERELLPGLLAVPVPGHTAGSYCYLDTARGLAFVGDLVLSFPDGLARPLAVLSDDDAAYVASLRAFAARAPSLGLAGHGPPILEGFGEALRGLAKQPRKTAPTRQRLLRRLRRMAWFAYHLWSAGRG